MDEAKRRDVDGWLAERLFGWTAIVADNGRTWFRDPEGLHSGMEPPRYSSTGDGMLAVLSAMVAQRFRYMLSRGCRWGEAVESTQAWFYRHDYQRNRPPEEGSATDDDLAAAVALAAARALGWEG